MCDAVAAAGVEGAEGIVDEEERWLARLGRDRRRETEAEAQRRRPGLAVRSEGPCAEVADREREVVAVRADERRPADELVRPPRRQLLTERFLDRSRVPATLGA